jgi:hypothetical protein
MADFSNSEDEIPYPLPPTTLAPTTTKETTTPPLVFQVPTSSSACDHNTATFKLPKKHQTLASAKAKQHVEKKKASQHCLWQFQPFFHGSNYFFLDDN